MNRVTNYLILDTETATLPFVNEWELSSEEKKKIAIARPLIYDIGWTIATRTHGITLKRNFLVAEVFSVPSIFNTAYYHEKRPKYIEMITRGEITVMPWNVIMDILIADLRDASYVCAYNAMFDFKKAIPFTELYIKMLYSPNFFEWEEMQKRICDDIATGNIKKPQKEFEPEIFRFRNKTYPLFDLWGLSCKYLLNNDDYKKACINNDWTTASGKYFKTSAETAFRFCENIYDFNESHTALEDAIIESMLFAKIVKKKISNLEIGIEYFPFRILGRADLYEEM